MTAEFVVERLRCRLKEKDAEIARLTAELARLRSMPLPSPFTPPSSPVVICGRPFEAYLPGEHC